MSEILTNGIHNQNLLNPLQSSGSSLPDQTSPSVIHCDKAALEKVSNSVASLNMLTSSGQADLNTLTSGGQASLDLVISGTFIHATWDRGLQILQGHVMGVKDGKIVFITNSKTFETHAPSIKASRTLVLNESQFVIPGLIDSHAHAPQFPFMGTGSGMELLDWLQAYTFPTETRVDGDARYAADVYKKCVSRTLKCGSTTVCYYGTIGLDANLSLVDTIDAFGQRAYVGKVNMDMNSPETYTEDTKASLTDTRIFIEKVKAKNNPLITPVVTPRFAISCSDELMVGLGRLVEEWDLPVQTHISENPSEICFVASLFPKASSYADVYDTHGLLRPRTILGHGVHLRDEELTLIKARGAGVSHCPNSNFCLHSGVLDVRRLLDAGVKVGLGTDFAGGNSPSILDAIRRALEASVVTSLKTSDDTSHGTDGKSVTQKPLTYKDMFFLATLGNSQLLGLDHVIGDLTPGKDLDCLVVDLEGQGSPLDVFPGETMEEMFQKFLVQGDDRNIKHVFVKGNEVTPA